MFVNIFFIFITAYNVVMYKGGKWRKWAYNAIFTKNVYREQNALC